MVAVSWLTYVLLRAYDSRVPFIEPLCLDFRISRSYDGDQVDAAMKTRLKKAFYELAKRYHPDLNKEGHHAKFEEISKAYAELVKGQAPDNLGLEDDDTFEFSHLAAEEEDGSEEDGNRTRLANPVVYCDDTTKTPAWLPHPDIVVFTLQDYEHGDIRRWIRYNLGMQELILVAEGTIYSMKKCLYHFGRLGYVIDLIQPIDTHPHRRELCAIFKLRWVEKVKRHAGQERFDNLLEVSLLALGSDVAISVCSWCG